MTRKLVTVLSLSAAALICFPGAGRAQQPSAHARMIPAVSVFLSGDYFSPNFRDINAAYEAIQKNYYLPAGRGFKDYYSIMGGIRISPVQQQSLRLELGLSLYKSQLGNSLQQAQSINFLQMYYLGGTYMVNFPVSPFSFFIGTGPGYYWLNTEQTYSGRPGVAVVDAGLFQIHGTAGIEYFHPSGVSVALEGGYSYATTPYPQRADLDFTLQGYNAGIQINVPLVNSF